MYNPLTGFENDPKVSNCIRAFAEHPEIAEEIKAYYILEKVDDDGYTEDRHLIAETTWKTGDFIHFTHKIVGRDFQDPYEGHEGPTDGRDFEGQFAIIPKKRAKKIIDFQKALGKVTKYRNLEDIPKREDMKKKSRLVTKKSTGPTLYSKLEDIKNEIDKYLKWDHVNDDTNEDIPEDNITASYRLYTKEGIIIFSVSVFDKTKNGNEIFTGFSKPGSEQFENTGLYNFNNVNKMLKNVANVAATKYHIEEAPVEDLPEMGNDDDKEFLKSIGIRSSQKKAYAPNVAQAANTFLEKYIGKILSPSELKEAISSVSSSWKDVVNYMKDFSLIVPDGNNFKILNRDMVDDMKIRTGSKHAATSPTPPGAALVSAIKNRKQNPEDFETFKALFNAFKEDFSATSGQEGCYYIMERLGFLEKDINPLLGLGSTGTPEEKFVRNYWDEVNRQYDEKKNQDRTTKYGPDLVALCKEVYAYANQPENYENGWDTVAEAWDLEELAEEIKDCKTLDEALSIMKQYKTASSKTGKQKRSRLMKRRAGIELDWDPATRRDIGREEARASDKILRDLGTYVEKLKSSLIQNGVSLGQALSNMNLKELFTSTDYTKRSLGNKLRSQTEQFLKNYPEKEQNFFKENYGQNISDILRKVVKTSNIDPQMYDIKPDISQDVLEKKSMDADRYYGGPDESGPDPDEVTQALVSKFPMALGFISQKIDPQSPDWDIMNKVSDEMYPKEFIDRVEVDLWDGDDVYYFDYDVDASEIEQINANFLKRQHELGSTNPEPLCKLELVPYHELPNKVIEKLEEDFEDYVDLDPEPWVD